MENWCCHQFLIAVVIRTKLAADAKPGTFHGLHCGDVLDDRRGHQVSTQKWQPRHWLLPSAINIPGLSHLLDEIINAGKRVLHLKKQIMGLRQFKIHTNTESLPQPEAQNNNRSIDFIHGTANP